jgi:hypothetical protein
MEHLKGASLEKVLALLVHIRQDYKYLPETNTSLLQTLIIYGRKIFYNIGPSGCIQSTLFSS